MTKRERLIWVAALLEGEGCFRVKPGSIAGYRHSLVVNIGSTDEDVVLRCCAEFPNHGKVHVRQRQDHRHWKPLYSTEWYGQAAEDLMRAVQPFMCARRTQRIQACLSTPNLSHHPGKANQSRSRGTNGQFVPTKV
jgi:hypothetical protein